MAWGSVGLAGAGLMGNGGRRCWFALRFSIGEQDKGGDRLQTKELLRRLTEGAGVSGHEGGIGALVGEAFSPYAERVELDRLGNLVAVRGGCGPAPRVGIMLAAHMDEIGLMVAKIEDNGYLRFAEVGGFDPRTLVGQEVVVHGRREVPGIIGIKPPHIMSAAERKKAAKLRELFVDCGYGAEAIGDLVAVGDTITLKRNMVELCGEVVAGKALDDRAGVAVLYECLRRLAALRHSADVYAVATVQEEITFAGAITGTYGLRPDVGVAVDVDHAGPGLPEHRDLELGKGPVIAMGPNIHPLLHELMVKTAKECGVAYQETVAPGQTGTDAWPMQVSRTGVATALVSIPLRYMHSSVETGSLQDVREAGRLLAEFCARVDRACVEGLRWS